MSTALVYDQIAVKQIPSACAALHVELKWPWQSVKHQQLTTSVFTKAFALRTQFHDADTPIKNQHIGQGGETGRQKQVRKTGKLQGKAQ